MRGPSSDQSLGGGGRSGKRLLTFLPCSGRRVPIFRTPEANPTLAFIITAVSPHFPTLPPPYIKNVLLWLGKASRVFTMKISDKTLCRNIKSKGEKIRDQGRQTK